MEKKPSPHLWILDPDDDMRTLLADISRHWGYHTLELKRLEDAWNLLSFLSGKPDRPPPTLIIMDTDLDDGKSKSWMREVQALYPHTTLICHSEYIAMDMMWRQNNHTIHFYRKPAGLYPILRHLRSWQ